MLVTKNEYVWESFTEDEDDDVPDIPLEKSSSAAGGIGVATEKKGKSAGGQKSLMSFFGKK